MKFSPSYLNPRAKRSKLEYYTSKFWTLEKISLNFNLASFKSKILIQYKYRI